ncbi:phosphatase [Bacteroidia bacterium]|nr:phosphatase [Bacteroidia bacterium]
MDNNIAALFDLDGVIIDTEPQYDIFWKKTGEEYGLNIDHFEQVIKGTTLPNIIAKYFSHLPEEEQKTVATANRTFDLQMELVPIPGALEFLDELKKNGIRMGLVTSSSSEKLEVVFKTLPLLPYFDTVVSADRITKGKPDPMCYLLAAKDLDISPKHCIVFEDSFNGIASGNAAGMKVIGLSTTNPAESIREKTVKVIPNFKNFSVEDFLSTII